MRCPTLADLPPPPPGRTGWPWTEECPQLPDLMPDGRPWPRISIVTPSYNQGEFIEETIRSILLQGYPDLEYFIIDGGSKDGTPDVIGRYERFLSGWRSEKDGGQADAINVGLSRATGAWFQNINSDDVLLPGALQSVGILDNEVDVAAGDVVEFEGSRLYTVPNCNLNTSDLLEKQSRDNDTSWHQPGVFLRPERLRRLGGYVVELGYTFDHHLTCRYLEEASRIAYLGRTIVAFRIHPQQKSSAWSEIYAREAIQSRLLLAEALKSPFLRGKARRSARRLMLWRQVAEIMSSPWDDREWKALLSNLYHEPRLCFDRMFLGFLKRLPINVIRALASR